MRRILSFVLMLVLVVSTGCFTKQVDTQPAKNDFIIGVIPQQNTGKMKDGLEKLATFLGEKLNRKVVVQELADYGSIVENMGAGKVDLAYFGPFAYLIANNKTGAEALVATLVNGEPNYKALIITRKDSTIKAMADIKGKNFAFGDLGSTSGHIIPAFMLQKAGLEGVYTPIYTGGHENTVMAVLNKQADAGAVDSVIFELLVKKGTVNPEEVRVVAESEKLYEYPWAVRKDLESQDKETVQQAFLAVSDSQILEPFGASGYIVVDDSKYDDIRQAARELGIGLDSFTVQKR